MRHLRILFVFLICGRIVLGQVPQNKVDPKLAAASLAQARDLSGRGEYEKALPVFKKSAEQGSADAEEALGYIYQNGQGTPKNIDEAVRWYKAAVQHGSVFAGNALGLIYVEKKDAPVNYPEARKWFATSAERGDPEGAYNYGQSLENGMGGPKDISEAARYYTMAARSGNEAAQHRAVCLSPTIRDTMVELYKDFNKATRDLSGIDFSVITFGIENFMVSRTANPKQFLPTVVFVMIGSIKDGKDRFTLPGRNGMDFKVESLGGNLYEVSMKDSIRDLSGEIHRFSKRVSGPQWVLPAAR